MSISMSVSIFMSISISVSTSIYVCIYVYICVCIHVYINFCIYICLYQYLYRYVCLCPFLYLHLFISISTSLSMSAHWISSYPTHHHLRFGTCLSMESRSIVSLAFLIISYCSPLIWAPRNFSPLVSICSWKYLSMIVRWNHAKKKDFWIKMEIIRGKVR